jgi:23S rRNA pseudouridine1911/1915/1917 synthase
MERDDAPATGLHRFTVQTGQRPRIDAYLRACLPWRSRTQLQALIAGGQVTVNDSPCKASCRLKKGDVVRVTVPAPAMPALGFRPGEIPVLYLDRDILVLSKPPGILAHPIAGHQHDTLVNYVEETFGDRYGPPQICHRLDRETSGTMLFAFEPQVRRLLGRQFETHQVRKSYLAIVAGSFPAELQRIDVPIRAGPDLEDSLRGDRVKQSLTMARGLAMGRRASLVEAVPVTGRQNQIRIHLAARGFPLVGDERFGGPPPPPTAEHFLLHAERLCFYHPRLKLAAEITAPVPAAFAATLCAFGLERAAG